MLSFRDIAACWRQNGIVFPFSIITIGQPQGDEGRQPFMKPPVPIDFEALFNLSPNPYVLLAPDLALVYANEAYLRVTGRRREELIGRNMFEVFPADPATGSDRSVLQLQASFNRVLASGKPDVLALIHYPIPRTTTRGVIFEDRYWSATNIPLLDEQGRVVYILQHTVDITELHTLKQAFQEAESRQATELTAAQAEANVLHRAQVLQDTNQLLDAERRQLLRLFEQSPGFICFLSGPGHVFEIANSAFHQIVGHRELTGKPIREALPELADQGLFELLDQVYRSGEPYVGHDVLLRLQREPGGPQVKVYADFVCQPIVASDGKVSGIFVQGTDVTEQKQVEEELHRYRAQLEDLVLERTRELEQSEAALRHAQKLEAVGRLTGGIAHDFNNLLQVVGGNLQLLQRDSELSERSGQRVQAALRAVERGARLASQLLAFARRQPLEPVVLNLRNVLRDMDELLQRAMGEAVEIRQELADDLWNTFADPSQIENAILNLAINARDAMQNQGRLTISARNVTLSAQDVARQTEVEPGDYVMLAVADTGCGMTPAVQERVFEPFFTTKPGGQGTGLGLSMVYGFIKQTGGHIAVCSEPGKGTIFRLYLPRSHQEAAEPEPERLDPTLNGGSETILVVEDDDGVRRTAVELLSDLGYRVLEAADGEQGLEIIRRGVPVDLLFTDVVMPGTLHGVKLAEQAKAVQPGLKVLFTSGYARDAIIQGGRLTPGVSLLSKPYRREDLARKVRHALVNRRQQQSVQPAQPAVSAAANGKRRLRILLVEDEELIRAALEEVLEGAGHEIIAVGSAEEAQTQLAARSFDLLFTDLNLPGSSGAGLVVEARAHQPELQVVIATGQAQEELPAQLRDLLSSVVFLPKPYDIADVERAVEEAAEAASAASLR